MQKPRWKWKLQLCANCTKGYQLIYSSTTGIEVPSWTWVQDRLLKASEKPHVQTSFKENHKSSFQLYRVAAKYLEDIDGLSMVIEVSRLIQGHNLSKSRNSNPSIQSHAHPRGCLKLSRDFSGPVDPTHKTAEHLKLLVCKGCRQHPLLNLKRGNTFANIPKMWLLYYIIKLKSWYYLPMFICGVQIQVTNCQGCKWRCPVPSTPLILSRTGGIKTESRLPWWQSGSKNFSKSSFHMHAEISTLPPTRLLLLYYCCCHHEFPASN